MTASESKQPPPSLRHVLEGWAEPPSFHGRYGPVPRRTRQAAKKVTKLASAESRKPEPYDLEKLYERACDAANSDGIGCLGRVDLRRLPWVLFFPKADSAETRHSWLGGRPEVARDYRNWLVTQIRTSTVLALVNEFLRVYPVDLPTFEQWLRLLRDLRESATSPGLQQLEPDLFALHGDGKIVRRMVASRETDVRKLGLKEGLARCEFLKSGAREHLRATSRRLQNEENSREETEDLLNFLELDDGLRFGDGRMCGETANALLLPFAEESPAGSASLEMVCTWFVKRFGDPRLPAHDHRWRYVLPEAKNVICGWLVRRAFEQFFLLLDYTAYDYHWRYRKAFWKAYMQHGMVDEIWLILGRSARINLKHISDDNLPDGELLDADANQSVLLMRIKGTTVAEWSHNGSCRIWRKDNLSAPKLYRPRYYRNYLVSRTRDFRQRHDGSPQGRWQGLIARQIGEYTGQEVLRRKDYMP